MNETIIVAILGSGVLSAVVSGVFNLIGTKKKKKSEEEKRLEALEKGVSLLLLGEMERKADKCIKKQSVTREEQKWFLELYEVYKIQLKGNGYAEGMKKDVDSLPIEQ